MREAPRRHSAIAMGAFGLAAILGIAGRAVAEDEAPRERTHLPIGSVAPAIEVAAWLNVPEAQAPSTASLKGKPIYLEFWDTGCGPCVRQMPKVQEIFERYGPRGLIVLAVSGDGASKIETFAKEGGYTFPFGCDPGTPMREAYKVQSVPTSYLIDKDGKIAAVTSPSHAEYDIDKLLGFKPGPLGALDDYLDAVGSGDATLKRFHLERLVADGSAEVDLAKWARGEGPVPDAKPAVAPTKVDGAKALTDLAKAGAPSAGVKPPPDRALALRKAIADGGPASFDLGTWARDTYAREFPVTAKEIAALLAAKKLEEIVSTIVDRRPPSSALDGLLRVPALEDHCSKKIPEAKLLGRKGLMLLHWLFAKHPIKNEELNKEFWHEVGSSSWMENVSTHEVEGMDIAGQMLMKPMLPAWILRQYSRAFVMESLAAGKKPDLAKMASEAAKRRDAELKALKTKYPD